MNDSSTVVPGRYQHYKGPEYTVIGTARHSETEEELVVYRQEYGARGLWVRPKGMFTETVSVAGQTLPRFRRIDDRGAPSHPSVSNLFDSLPSHLPSEISETLLQAPEVKIERIISHGHASPPNFWYEQAQHEWVLVLRGSAKLEFEDMTLLMNAGDYVHIPAFQKHRVAWTSPNEPTVWLCVWYGTLAA